MAEVDKVALREHTLSRPGCTLHYWLGGPVDRPLVALLHGATMNHHMFDEQVTALLPHYQVLTWDSRGHGASRPLTGTFQLEDCADDFIAILDHLQVEQAVLVGQSMGGYIAQQVYLRAPQRVLAMGIIGSTCIALPYSRLEIWALKASLPLLRLWPFEHFKRTVARSIALKPEVQDYALAAISELSHEEFLTIWQAVTLAVDVNGIPGHHIRVPLLLTHGEHDATGTIRRDAPRWAAYEPDVEYVVIPDASHNANQDNPAFFNPVLLRFLQTRVG